MYSCFYLSIVCHDSEHCSVLLNVDEPLPFSSENASQCWNDETKTPDRVSLKSYTGKLGKANCWYKNNSCDKQKLLAQMMYLLEQA